MSEPFLQKGEDLSQHINDCIETLTFFKQVVESNPDFELDIGFRFVTTHEHAELFNQILKEHYGDDAVSEGIESFEEDTRFLH